MLLRKLLLREGPRKKDSQGEKKSIGLRPERGERVNKEACSRLFCVRCGPVCMFVCAVGSQGSMHVQRPQKSKEHGIFKYRKGAQISDVQKLRKT